MSGWWSRRRSSGVGSAVSEVGTATLIPAPPPPAAEWRLAALALDHGAALPPALMQAFCQEIDARAGMVVPGWPNPSTGALRLCTEGLPDWWAAGGNLLLLAEGVAVPELAPDLISGLASGSLLALGGGSCCHQVIFSGDNNFVVLGEGALLPTSGVAALSGGTVLIGGATTSTFMAQVDARNGGTVLIGRDNMWAAGVRLMTDDMHAIRDRVSGRRLNLRGGRIVIGPHVWLCERVIVMGGSLIGADSIVGAAAIVKNARLAANSVCVGAPARVVRSDVTWSRDDVP